LFAFGHKAAGHSPSGAGPETVFEQQNAASFIGDDCSGSNGKLRVT
jgi:hypothetical protein